MKNLLASVILLLSGLTYSQSKNPDLILKIVIESFSKVEDY
jgi:hypothetical protein